MLAAQAAGCRSVRRVGIKLGGGLGWCGSSPGGLSSAAGGGGVSWDLWGGLAGGLEVFGVSAAGGGGCCWLGGGMVGGGMATRYSEGLGS